MTKPSIFGWGLNLQHCARVIFVGVTHSFEAFYQAIRRSWRFGQLREVQAYIIASDIEGNVIASLDRKRADAEGMVAGMVKHMTDINALSIRGTTRIRPDYDARSGLTVPGWLQTEREAS